MVTKTATSKNGTEKLMSIPPVDIGMMTITLIGDAPLICHRWSDKARKQMLDKQTKQAKQGKEAKNPEEDYEQSLYKHPEGGYGFPAVAFKAAAVYACRSVDGIAMTQARSAFHVVGDLVKVNGEPRMREDMVRLGGTTADIRYRGEFPEWWCELLVRFNRGVLSEVQIVNLFNVAGFGVGVGEWRPEKSATGSYGLFHVATEDDMERLG